MLPLSMAPASDPFSMFSDWDTEGLALLGVLVVVAVSVFWYGSRRFAKERGSSSLRPKGRTLGIHGPRRRDAEFKVAVERLERRDATPIAKAGPDVVRIEATIVNASGSLGGPKDRACVWRNRAGAQPDSAVGAELVVVADATGRCGVENLEHARVTAVAERVGMHYEWLSLYVGDRVEVFGRFEPERVGDDGDDPSAVVYGTLGADGPVEIRLLERPEPADDPPDPAPDPAPDQSP